MTRRNAGFTLFEVMIALTIMALIMVALYQTLDASLATRDQLDLEARAARVGPEILDIIENDVRQAWVSNIYGDKVFFGEDATVRGEQADVLQFITSVDSTVTQNVQGYEVSSDLAEVGYRCKVNPEYEDVMELWRRQSYHVDEEPLKGGTYDLIYDRVVSFRIQYLPTMERTEEFVDAWDASEERRLPAAMLIDLVVEVGERSRGGPGFAALTRHHRRLLPLRSDSEIAMRVHPIIPTFTTASAGGGAAQGPDGGGPDDPDGGGGDPDNPFGGGGGGPGGPGGGGGGGGSGNPFDDLFNGGGGGGGGGLPGDIFGGG